MTINRCIKARRYLSCPRAARKSVTQWKLGSEGYNILKNILNSPAGHCSVVEH